MPVHQLQHLGYDDSGQYHMRTLQLVGLDMRAILFHCLQYVFPPYHAILQYSTPYEFLVLHGKYSTDCCFDPPTQSSLKLYIP